MTKKEFENWKAETARSTKAWTVDQIHDKPTDSLIYKGGENGHYIHVKDHVIEFGTYQGAIPHIGEACFQVTGTVGFGSNDQAWKSLLERAGVPFLMDILRLRMVDFHRRYEGFAGVAG